MRHEQVVEDHLVEQYLLQEMSAALRDEFEEHYFDCRECAADVKATAAFLEVAREELRRPSPVEERVTSSPVGEVKKWWAGLWTPAFAFSALAACLLVVLYQNVVVLPGIRTEVAELRAPEIAPTVSLIGAATRGGEVPSVSPGGAHTLVLQVDIPTQPQFVAYACNFYSPEQKLLGSVNVSPQQAKDTISLRMPLAGGQPGQYSLVVHGKSSASGSSTGVDLARYNFLVKSGSTGSGN